MEDLTNLLATVTLVPSGSAMVGFQVPSSLNFNFECQIPMLFFLKVFFILMCAHVCVCEKGLPAILCFMVVLNSLDQRTSKC